MRNSWDLGCVALHFLAECCHDSVETSAGGKGSSLTFPTRHAVDLTKFSVISNFLACEAYWLGWTRRRLRFPSGSCSLNSWTES